MRVAQNSSNLPDRDWLFRRKSDHRSLLPPFALLVLWTCAAAWLEYHHAFWRDEVRALSIALQGSDVFGMMRSLRGEGHPVLWYLILRGFYTIAGTTAVLPFASVLIGFITATLLLFCSPFRLWVSAIILLTGFFLGEYTVSARNYGISSILFFLIAITYSSKQNHSILLGILLFLLANTNAHSALIVLAFLFFWLIDSRNFEGSRSSALKGWALAAMIAAVGIGCCAVTVYPPQNDAVIIKPEVTTYRHVIGAVVLPAVTFDEMIYRPTSVLGIESVPRGLLNVFRVALSLLLFGSTLALLERSAALLAGVLSLIGLSLFFAIIYPGGYRHEGLWFAFLVTLYWISAERSDDQVLLRSRAVSTGLVRAGQASFIGIILLQFPVSYQYAQTLFNGVPNSQVRALAATLKKQNDLTSAIILPEPDYLLEALPYYVSNPIYLLRSDTFAPFTYFKKDGKLAVSLSDLLVTANDLCRAQHKPVVIVLQPDLVTLRSKQQVEEGYNWTFSATPDEMATLTSSTDFLGRFEPALSDETFSAYALRPPCLAPSSR